MKETNLKLRALRHPIESLSEVLYARGHELLSKFARVSTDPEKLLKKFSGEVESGGTSRDYFREILRERFFLSDLNRKELYLELMTSAGCFDDILDDADLVHENRFASSLIDRHPDVGSGEVRELERSRRIRKRLKNDFRTIEPLLDLNRFHRAVWLGKAYWLSRSEEHTDKFKTLIDDWAECNPVGRGINWLVPGEAAIRAINIIVGLLYFMSSDRIDESFLRRLLSILYQHGLFIRSNLSTSGGGLQGRLASLAGLIFLGILFRDTSRGGHWIEFAVRELEREAEAGISDDGNIQGSSFGDLRLAAESLTASLVLLKLNRFHVSDMLSGRLERMLNFLASVTMRNGCVPDSGWTSGARIFRMSSRSRSNDHRDLLAAGAALFGSGAMKAASGGFSEPALLLLGVEGYEKFAAVDGDLSISSVLYRDAGLAVMRTGKDFASFDFGSGPGISEIIPPFSFTVAGKNQFIVEPGSRDYSSFTPGTPETESAQGRNTLTIGRPKRAGVTEDGTFGKGPSPPELLGWQSDEWQDFVEAQYHPLMWPAASLIHKRNITFNKRQRTFRVEDDLVGEGKHHIEMIFHFAPGLLVVDLGRNFLALEGEEFALMKFQHPFVIENMEHSDERSRPVTSKAARVTLEADFPARIETYIFITSNEDDMNYLLNRIQSSGPRL